MVLSRWTECNDNLNNIPTTIVAVFHNVERELREHINDFETTKGIKSSERGDALS